MKIVRYTAVWCVPCKRFGPIADDVAQDLGLDLQVVDIDDEDAPGVQSIPFVRLLDDDGSVVAEHAGALSYEAFSSWVTNAIGIKAND